MTRDTRCAFRVILSPVSDPVRHGSPMRSDQLFRLPSGRSFRWKSAALADQTPLLYPVFRFGRTGLQRTRHYQRQNTAPWQVVVGWDHESGPGQERSPGVSPGSGDSIAQFGNPGRRMRWRVYGQPSGARSDWICFGLANGVVLRPPLRVTSMRRTRAKALQGRTATKLQERGTQCAGRRSCKRRRCGSRSPIRPLSGEVLRADAWEHA